MEPTTRCQACGQDVPPGRFCARCGHPLTDPVPGQATDAIHGQEVEVTQQPAVTQELAVTQDADAVESGSRPRLGNRSVGIVATTLALLAVAGYLLFGTGGESHTVTGQLALTTASNLSVGSTCEGTGGYSDIAPGTQVVLEDETGATLATSSFGTGTFDGVSCIFGFEFADVPKAAFYRVHQNGDRGVLQYSYQDMVDSAWSVSLTLGDLGED